MVSDGLDGKRRDPAKAIFDNAELMRRRKSPIPVREQTEEIGRVIVDRPYRRGEDQECAFRLKAA